MKTWVKQQFRKKTRVYILPTKMGGYLIGLIFLMFLLAIGYDNNLLLIFTLFLFSFNLLWLVQSHFHLQNLKLSNVSIHNGHALESLSFKAFWANSPTAPIEWELTLEHTVSAVKTNLFEQTENASTGEIVLPKRGRLNWKFLKVATVLPYGLYRIWCFYPIKLETFAYPSLIPSYRLPDFQSKDSGENVAMGRAGSEDIWNLTPYQGEESRKISWKHYARSGELLIKEGEEFHDPVFIIKLHPPKTGLEEYLSQVATQMVECHCKGIPFLFEGTHGKLGPAHHSDHLHQCLKVLSLC